jgi:hypothetical protein
MIGRPKRGRRHGAGDLRWSVRARQDGEFTDHAEGAVVEDVAMEQPSAHGSTAAYVAAWSQDRTRVRGRVWG